MTQANEPNFEIKSYLKADLARMYHPYLPESYAMSKMRAWIRKCADLATQMYAAGEGKNDHYYTRRQVALIVKYLDAP